MRRLIISFLSTGTAAALMAGGIFITAPTPATADGMTAKQAQMLVRGGKLYDNWPSVIGVRPKGTHKSWPATNTKKKGSATHRCKSCHGWDYMGKDGAYASGSYKTGIIGVRALANGDQAKIIGVLGDSTHGYGGVIPPADMQAIALFVAKGQVDMNPYIDRAAKKPKGDIGRGGVYYATVCSNCHGMDGMKPKDMKSFGKQMGNPWEVMHKILNGHPGEDMPSLRAFDPQVAADIMTHMATLPK